MRSLSMAVYALACTAVVLPSLALAQDAGVPPAPGQDAGASPATTDPGGPASPRQGAQETAGSAPVQQVYIGSAGRLQLGGWAEAFWQWNANHPSNGVTNERAYDDRAATFTISNVVADAQWSYDRVAAHVTLQLGHTPEAYYAGEPSVAAMGSAGASGPPVWKFLQQATLAWTAPLGDGLLVEAGLFLSPIGAENLAVKDSWNWSRSDLFFALPAYHTGIRATYTLAPNLTATAGVYNGWNSVVDNNDEKSVSAQLNYFVLHKLSFRLVYFGGVERPTDAPQGRAWRHTFDGWVMYYPNRWLTLMVHGDAGLEPQTFGLSSWESVALYIRFKVARWLMISGRVDAFREDVPDASQRARDAIFFPGASFVSSATLTLDFRPAPNLMFRLEYRHDQADGAIYFAGTVPADGSTNARSQDTFLIGTTAWF